MGDKLAEKMEAGAYAGLGPDTELMLVFANGSIGFRYGPYPAADAGPIINRAIELGMPVMLSFQAGMVPDWEMLTDLFGGPQGLQALREKMAAASQEHGED